MKSIGKAERILLLSILVLGCLFRIIGANWGFPLLFHPDEHAITENAFGIIKNKTLDPQFYKWPAHISIYTNAITYTVVSLVKYKLPLVSTFEDNITFYHFISRLIVATLGTLSIFVAYLIGKEYTVKMGIITAFLFAFFPAYILHAHYATTAISLSLFILLVVLFAIKYLKNPKILYLLLMCLFSALSTGEKYPGVLVTLLPAIVIILTHYKSIKTTLFLLIKAGLMFSLSLFIFTPMFYIKPKQIYWTLLLLTSSKDAPLGMEYSGFLGSLLYYSKEYLSNTGYILIFFSVIGAIFVIKRHKMLSIPIFFGIIYWIALSLLVSVHVERYATPMYISPLILAAYGIVTVYDGIKTHNKKILGFVFYVAIFFSSLSLILQSGVRTSLFTLKDTRNVAYEFCIDHNITEADSIYEAYTPFAPGFFGLNQLFWNYEDRVKNNKKYVIISEMYDKYLREKERYSYQLGIYNEIFSLPLVEEFNRTVRIGFLYEVTYLGEIGKILKSLDFFRMYFTDKENLIMGPPIKIYKLYSEE